MSEGEMRTLIELYLQSHKDKALRNLLTGKPPEELKSSKTSSGNDREPTKSFIDYWLESDGDVAKAIKETVKSRSHSKRMAIERLRVFVEWLKRKTHEKCDITWPPIDIDNDFERMIYMMRALQEDPHLRGTDTIDIYLSNTLWVSERTIADDLSRMNHLDHTNQATLLNNTLAINGMSRANGSVSFASTAHPLLLIENLTSISMMLISMLEKAEDPRYHDALMVTVGHVWSQLTEYARGRVVEAVTKWCGENSEVISRICKLSVDAEMLQFVPENQTFENIEGLLMECVKLDKQCCIMYEQEGEMMFCRGLPRIIHGDYYSILIMTDDGHEIPIPLRKIKSCKVEAGLQ